MLRTLRVLMLMPWALLLGCTSTAPSADLRLPATAPQSAIPLEAFFASTSLDDPKLSPDGRFIAGLRTLGGYRNLVKIDLETGKTSPITVFDNDSLETFEWATNERLLLSCTFKGGFIRKLFAIDADGQNLFDFQERGNAREELAPSARQQFGDQIVSVLPDDPNNVLVSYNYFPRRDWAASDVFKLNIFTGRAVEVVHSGENPRLWFASPSGDVNIGAGANRGQAFFVHRAQVGDEWKRFGPEEGMSLTDSTFVPLGVSEDLNVLYVRSRHESDRFAVYRYDVRTREFSPPVFAHPDVDVVGPLVYANPAPGAPTRVIGVEYEDDFNRIHWITGSIPSGKPWPTSSMRRSQAPSTASCPGAGTIGACSYLRGATATRAPTISSTVR